MTAVRDVVPWTNTLRSSLLASSTANSTDMGVQVCAAASQGRGMGCWGAFVLRPLQVILQYGMTLLLLL
jgi:hypothetical protein